MPNARARHLALALLLHAVVVVAAAGCKKPPSGPQWYRAAIGSPGEESVFFLQLPSQGAPGPASIENGKEHLSIDHRWREGESTLTFELYDSHIISKLQPDGTLKGSWHVSHQDASLPFVATPIESPDPRTRYGVAGQAPDGDVSGAWTVSVEGTANKMKGVFEQDPLGIVTGTVERERGSDLRFLAGNLAGRRLMLSTFEGLHTVFIHGELSKDGRTLNGRFIVHGPISHDTMLTATRAAPDLDIDVGAVVQLQKGATTLSIPELKRLPYAGSPVIVDMYGSWCPACADTIPLLKELSQKHKQDGLQILGIAFEMSDDRDYCLQQIRLFRRRFDPPWEIVARVGQAEKMPDILPAEIAHVENLPITAFIARDGTVRAVLEGFAGPASGADYEKQRKVFETLAADITRPKAR